MNDKPKKSVFHSADTFFVLILFAAFVLMALFISATGALSYKKSAVQMEERFNKQTCISYITAKIRANNESGKISIVDFNGKEALCISDNFGETVYNTYIYQHDGMVRELFCNAEITLDPAAGSALTEAAELSFEKEGSLYKITVTDENGSSCEFFVNAL